LLSASIQDVWSADNLKRLLSYLRVAQVIFQHWVQGFGNCNLTESANIDVVTKRELLLSGRGWWRRYWVQALFLWATAWTMT
jgi:hypothetical protein